MASYDPDRGVLMLQYNDGSKYAYYRVSQTEWAALISGTGSVGQFVNSTIKGHSYAKIG